LISQSRGLGDVYKRQLEVTIFRMIQEILANAIKHAHATEINIHMTQHNDSFNIIIDDNGLGFAPKEFNLNEGMGLFNIEKKIESMGGIFSVDSTIGNGTSVVIDLPI
jgi:two-component system sensor histidine kinase DegS